MPLPTDSRAAAGWLVLEATKLLASTAGAGVIAVWWFAYQIQGPLDDMRGERKDDIRAAESRLARELDQRFGSVEKLLMRVEGTLNGMAIQSREDNQRMWSEIGRRVEHQTFRDVVTDVTGRLSTIERDLRERRVLAPPPRGGGER